MQRRQQFDVARLASVGVVLGADDRGEVRGLDLVVQLADPGAEQMDDPEGPGRMDAAEDDQRALPVRSWEAAEVAASQLCCCF